MEKLLMGIDVGTSSCKVALFDTSGSVVSQSTKRVPGLLSCTRSRRAESLGMVGGNLSCRERGVADCFR